MEHLKTSEWHFDLKSSSRLEQLLLAVRSAGPSSITMCSIRLYFKAVALEVESRDWTFIRILPTLCCYRIMRRSPSIQWSFDIESAGACLRADRPSEIIYPRNIPANARTEVPKPPQFGVTHYEELQIPTPDGESLSAFLLTPSNKQFAQNVTILMFHGNAGNIGYRLPIAKILSEDIGCNVLMLQYRGYGLSTGTPNEKGLAIDAQTGLDYIRGRADLRKTKIIIYGQSLGGAVGVGLAAKNQATGDIAGIILENTFTSIRKLIPR